MPESVEAILTVLGIALSAVATPLFLREVLLRERALRARRRRHDRRVLETAELEETTGPVLVSPSVDRLSYGDDRVPPRRPRRRPASLAPPARDIRAG